MESFSSHHVRPSLYKIVISRQGQLVMVGRLETRELPHVIGLDGVARPNVALKMPR